ncbi:hypothetical protein N5D03_03130 [Empedobacter sp. GD03861]|uniref:hypothetical protein n=1 Tax=Empedobacter sp. GD03861 TaxID=2975390 RepID=UPI00244ABB9A|nr:hypothetical protein [Empedobacter sp. GD03861]MDH0673534.1 hypothetical protein [Empedobacter sp. GD03861]
MKKTLLLISFIIFSSFNVFAQKQKDYKSSEVIISKDFENKLDPIKSNFNRINSIKIWSKIKEVETDDSTEGGFINYYFLNDKLEKIIVRKFGESGQYLAEYYLLNDKLSFVFEQDTTYNFPLYWKEFDDKKSIIEESRYYFEDRKLIHFIGKSKNYKTESKDTLDEFDEIIKMENNYK